MHPTRAIALIAALAVGLAACSAPSTTTPTRSEATAGASATTANPQVELRGFAFSPATLTVPAGTTVTFRNVDAVRHDVVNGKDGSKAADAAFDLQIDPGKLGTVTFDKAGTFDVTCTIHPTMNMTVTVR